MFQKKPVQFPLPWLEPPKLAPQKRLMAPKDWANIQDPRVRIPKIIYCIPKLALANILEGLAPTGVTVILANMASGSSKASPRFTEPSEGKLEAGGNLGGQ